MTRKVFMKKLMSYLKNISEEERKNVENFYNEMFDEQGINQDEEVPSSFGEPRKVAMEILADNIEMDNEKEDKKDKKSLFKKFSFVTLGVFDYPFLVPVFLIAIICFALWVVFSMIALMISLVTIPFSLIFNFAYAMKWGLKILIFIIVSFAFIGIIKFLYNLLIKDISKDPVKYTKKYMQIKYSDDEEDDYDDDDDMEDDMEYDDVANMDSIFTGIKKVDIQANVLNVKIVQTDEKDVYVKARNLKKSTLHCDKKGDILKIYNEKIKGIVNKHGMKIDEKYIAESTFTVYIPDDISFTGEFNASKVEFTNNYFRNLNLDLNAASATLNNVQVEVFDAGVHASNITGDVEYQNDFDLSVEAGNANLSVDRLGGEINYWYEVQMGSVNLFGEIFHGFNTNGRKTKGKNINMRVNCHAGKVTLK